MAWVASFNDAHGFVPLGSVVFTGTAPSLDEFSEDLGSASALLLGVFLQLSHSGDLVTCEIINPSAFNVSSFKSCKSYKSCK